jgi:hypothetical protein
VTQIVERLPSRHEKNKKQKQKNLFSPWFSGLNLEETRQAVSGGKMVFIESLLFTFQMLYIHDFI